MSRPILTKLCKRKSYLHFHFKQKRHYWLVTAKMEGLLTGFVHLNLDNAHSSYNTFVLIKETSGEERIFSPYHACFNDKIVWTTAEVAHLYQTYTVYITTLISPGSITTYLNVAVVLGKLSHVHAHFHISLVCLVWKDNKRKKYLQRMLRFMWLLPIFTHF